MSGEPKRRILWIHPGGLVPVGGGGAARTWALIDYLRASDYQVELLTGDQGAYNTELAARVDRLWIRPREDRHAGKPPAAVRARNWLKTRYRAFDPDLRGPRWLRSRTGGMVRLEDNLLARNRRPSLEQFAGEVAYGNPPFAAIASYAWLAPALDHMPPGTLRLLDTIDIQHARRANAAGAGGDLSHLVCTREEEARALNRADVLLAIQAEEAAVLRAMCPERDVLTVGHAHPVPDYAPSPEGARELLYVGNRYDPNIRGLRDILRHIWPEVRRACPGATLSICGRVGELAGRPGAGVTVYGQVPDLAPYYQRAAVVLNPVPYGTGLKIKTVEGLAHGRAVVCTEAGTGGLGDPATLPLRVSDGHREMATQIVDLLDDPEARHGLERRAWEFAQTHFAPERVYGPLLARLEDS